MNRTIHPTLALALSFAAPLSTFAQSDAPATRAQVRAELVELERAGYDPRWDRWTYPSGLQLAQARLNASRSGNANGYRSVTPSDPAAGLQPDR